MRQSPAEEAILDQAYAVGRFVAFRRLATRAGCPYAGRQTDLRNAWLDGFEHGLWDARIATNAGEFASDAVDDLASLGS